MKVFLIVATLVIIATIGTGFWIFNAGKGAAASINIHDQAFVARGKNLYDRECATCHGKNLEGQTPNWRKRLPDGSLPAPPHDLSGHTWHHPDQILFEVTKYGSIRDARAVSRSNMPAFENKMSDADIWAVLSYIKSRWPAEIIARHDRLNRQYKPGR